ncbi:MAG: TerB family tellurite resistance protein [Candidatus Marinimicrobia bacterium]|nr:TerB family tellurite resistance protein [Candidatus Neomarinimicrobiota bacterium]MDD5581813.1 TerB family tellurite resistance protein [Candidatus Neomarinimicrobiota bacterium]
MAISYKTIIGAGLGWVLFGPIGAILGGIFGSRLDEKNKNAQRISSGYSYGAPPTQTQMGDFYVSLIIVFAYIVKADKKIKKGEIAYIKKYLMQTLSDQKFVQELMFLFKQTLDKDIDITNVVRQISMYLDMSSRIQFLHLLFGLAQADGSIDVAEKKSIEQIALNLGLSYQDYESILAIYEPKTNDALYKILEVSPNASNEEIIASYKRLAQLYHPDKVAHLGPDLIRTAEEKFKQINDAYRQIRSIRNF